MIYDGERYQPFMVAAQLNNKMANSEIEQCVIVCLDKCVWIRCPTIQTRLRRSVLWKVERYTLISYKVERFIG